MPTRKIAATWQQTNSLANLEKHMDKKTEQGTLPGWTLLVGTAAPVIAAAILAACREFGLSWWIGVPVAAGIVVGGLLWERAVERKYLPAQRHR
jgi:hypothetical protein